jgi:ligand-binding sensor domain-containing protein
MHFNKSFIAPFIAVLLISTLSGQTQPLRVYDLHDWVTYRNSNYITSITEGQEYIYFGSSGGVLSFHRFGRYWGLPFTTSSGLIDDYINAVLFVNANSTLWAAHRGGLSYLRLGSYSWTNLEETPTDVTRLGENDGYIWAETASGRFIQLDKFGMFIKSTANIQPPNVRWAPCRYDSVPNIVNYAFDRNFQFDARSRILDNYMRPFPLSLFYVNTQSDVFGGVWGLGAFEGNTLIKLLRVHPAGPLQNSISAMTMDEKSIWLGNNSYRNDAENNRFGLAEFDKQDYRWNYFEAGLIAELASANINDLLQSNNYLCIATDLGLTIYNLKQNRWRRFTMAQGISDENITCLEGTDTLVWIGTPRGLSMLNLKDLKLRRIRLDPAFMTTRINKIKYDGQNLWFTTGNGLYSLDRKAAKLTHYDQYGNIIEPGSAVAGDFGALAVNSEWLVCARSGGLLAFDKRQKKWLELPLPAILTNLKINDLNLYQDFLWIATNDGAIMMRLTDYYFEHYTTADGLANSMVNRVLTDGELVWFGTANGLTSFKWSKYVLPQ